MLLPTEEWVNLPGYSDREGWNALFGDTRDTFIKRGEAKLDYKWQVITASMYLEYERSGSRVIMESPNSDNSSALADLFWAELAEGKGRFLPALIDGVYFFCEMTSWSLSAHLQYQSTRRSLPDYREHVFDLVAGDYGSMLSWVWWLMHDEFDKTDPVIANRLRYEIDRRILTPFMNQPFWWMGINASPNTVINNWNPWCNCNALQCFLLVEPDDERRAKAVWRTMCLVDNYLNRVGGDGCCDEGCSYWSQAAGRLVDYLDVLGRASGGKLSLFENPLIRDMGEYICRSYVGGGHSVNFADASPNVIPNAALVYRYGSLTASKDLVHLGISVNNNNPTIGTCFWRNIRHLELWDEITNPGNSVSPAINSKASSYTWYPETEVCYMRENGGLFFAAKGGHNNESHNHNDVGSFNIYIDNDPVLLDVGVGTYTRQTFSGERYKIWTMTSDYHNVPRVNGYAQCPGQSFHSSDVSFNSKKKRFTLDIASAYPKEAGIRSWKRDFTVKGTTVSLTENYVLDSATVPNELHFMAHSEPVIISDGIISIPTGEKALTVSYPSSKLSATIEKIELDDVSLQRNWKSENLWRINLVAKDISTKGEYTIVFHSKSK